MESFHNTLFLEGASPPITSILYVLYVYTFLWHFLGKYVLKNQFAPQYWTVRYAPVSNLFSVRTLWVVPVSTKLEAIVLTSELCQPAIKLIFYINYTPPALTNKPVLLVFF